MRVSIRSVCFWALLAVFLGSPALADEVRWVASPVGDLSFRGVIDWNGAAGSMRRGTIHPATAPSFIADAAFCSYFVRPGVCRQALMLGSDSVPLSALLPGFDRAFRSLFREAPSGQGMMTLSFETPFTDSYELTWRSERRWTLDAQALRSLPELGALIDPAAMEWLTNDFEVESATVRIQFFPLYYDTATLTAKGLGSGDHSEMIADVRLLGTSPTSRGMFRWLRTRLDLRIERLPLRLVNRRQR